MILARVSENADSQLAGREALVAAFKLPEGLTFWECGDQHVFFVVTELPDWVGFTSYLVAKKGDVMHRNAFDPYSTEAIATALREFQDYLNKL